MHFSLQVLENKASDHMVNLFNFFFYFHVVQYILYALILKINILSLVFFGMIKN
jgi:hypothetical protein